MACIQWSRHGKVEEEGWWEAKEGAQESRMEQAGSVQQSHLNKQTQLDMIRGSMNCGGTGASPHEHCITGAGSQSRTGGDCLVRYGDRSLPAGQVHGEHHHWWSKGSEEGGVKLRQLDIVKGEGRARGGGGGCRL